MQHLIPASALEYLSVLQKNNNRDWFNSNKETFLEQQQLIEDFADDLLQLLSNHDYIETPTGKKSLHRIYRDSRFSLDKTPYKTNWSGSFRRATSQLRGGYHFHLAPGNSFIGGGFQSPSSPDLKLIRDEISHDALPLRKILNDPAFILTFGAIEGKQLKTVPQGYDLNNEGIDLLRFQQFRLRKCFTDEEVLSSNFQNEANEVFKTMRPFFNFMSAALTSDKNGLLL